MVRCAFELVLDGTPRSVLLAPERAAGIESVAAFLQAVDSQLQETCGSPWVLSSRCSYLREVGDSFVGSYPADCGARRRLFAGPAAEAGDEVPTLWAVGEELCWSGHLAKGAPATPFLLHRANKFVVTAVSKVPVDVRSLNLAGVTHLEVPITRATLTAEVKAHLAGQLAGHGIYGARVEELALSAGEWHTELCLQQSLAEQGIDHTSGLWLQANPASPPGALVVLCGFLLAVIIR